MEFAGKKNGTGDCDLCHLSPCDCSIVCFDWSHLPMESGWIHGRRPRGPFVSPSPSPPQRLFRYWNLWCSINLFLSCLPFRLEVVLIDFRILERVEASFSRAANRRGCWGNGSQGQRKCSGSRRAGVVWVESFIAVQRRRGGLSVCDFCYSP
ncbi:hypothetical protein E2320_013012 [Naja naja]|nr:hypothetical protein E2320_013012 [Naja naja]